MTRKLLLISNSTNPGEDYLGWPQQYIHQFLQKNNVKRVLFIPYAGVSISHDDYTKKVRSVFTKLGYEIDSVHETKQVMKAVQQAEAIAVGGGNTFSLVRELQRTGLMQAIREKALAGTPYMGWSAGANVACPSMKTTNDMPIEQPFSFDCMNLVPFQINPHYLDAHPSNHGGETREQRILEFLAVNPDIYVAGLRETCLLELENNKLELKGIHPMRLFRQGQETREIQPGTTLDFLL